MYQKDSYCSYCGHPFRPDAPWPRTCTHCGRTTYRNPLPVAVVLLPIDDEGLLVVRRDIDPGRGLLALPGGFIELGETWQEAAVRELFEETGITIQPDTLRPFHVASAPDGTLLVFGLAPPYPAADLPPFTPRPECSERLIIRDATNFAFSLHAEAVHLFLENRMQTNTNF